MNKKTSNHKTRQFVLFQTLKSSAKYVLLFKRNFIIWCLINFAFIFTLSKIPNGWTNSLSIIWLIFYYIFWTIFIRYINQRRPYFSLIRIFNGLIPSSKIMFINISIYILLLIIPYLPLLMGFKDNYLNFFEEYMNFLQENDALVGKYLFYLFMLIISPYTFTRPYIAWISSLVGKNRSILDAYKKTTGNNISFILLAIIMSGILAVLYYIDVKLNIGTLKYIASILLVYYNIVFIEIYKVFYKRKNNPKTKKSSG